MRGVDGLIHRDEYDDQHGHDINSQAPKQSLGSERKIFSAEVGTALGGDDLIRFEQRENGSRILQAELFGFDVIGHVNRNVAPGERALIFRNIHVM